MSEKLLRVWVNVLVRLETGQAGQTTAEYALVMLAAAAVAGTAEEPAPAPGAASAAVALAAFAARCRITHARSVARSGSPT